MADAFVVGACCVLLAADLAVRLRRLPATQTQHRGLPIVVVDGPFEVHATSYPLEAQLGFDVEISTLEIRYGGHRYQITKWGRGKFTDLDEAWDVDTAEMVVLDSRAL